MVVLKFIPKAHGCQQLRSELETLRQIRSNHVAQLLAFNLNVNYRSEDGATLNCALLVAEYVSGGELFDVLELSLASAHSKKIARTYFKQLMDGLRACHEAGVIHGSIKPQNLLLDANYQLKIADGGVHSRTMFKGDVDADMRGYQSPEVHERKPCSAASDIFSCGVILFILLCGYAPFKKATPKCRWYRPLAKNDATAFWKLHRESAITDTAQDLITRMLCYDSEQRITISRIKRHPWYQHDPLTGKALASELRELHRLREIQRRTEAEKLANAELKSSRSLRPLMDEPLLSECAVPQLSADEAFALNDTWTNRLLSPQYVLRHIEKQVRVLGGVANIDFDGATMEVRLALMSRRARGAAQTLTLQIRILRDVARECFVVKFERLCGDALCFARVRRKLVRMCGHCLTGVPNRHFRCAERDRQRAEQLFGVRR